MGVPATVALTVVVLLVVLAVALPVGRRGLSAAVRALVRWPALIRAELRGAAPLEADRSGRSERTGPIGPTERTGPIERIAPDGRVDTTPDIPVVTRGLPIVDRPGPTGARTGGNR